jgi:hypothetical protein
MRFYWKNNSSLFIQAVLRSFYHPLKHLCWPGQFRKERRQCEEAKGNELMDFQFNFALLSFKLLPRNSFPL